MITYLLLAALLCALLYNLLLRQEIRRLNSPLILPEVRGLAFHGVPTAELEILRNCYPDREPDEMRARIAAMVTTDYTKR